MRAREPEPLEGIAVVLLDADCRLPASRAAGPREGGAGLQHATAVQQRQPGLGAERGQVQILPDRALACAAGELVKLGAAAGRSGRVTSTSRRASRRGGSRRAVAKLRGTQPRCTSTTALAALERSGVTT